VDNVAQWIEQLGLGQYASVFAENDIDGEVLADLTDSDLEKIGVTLGHRKKILKAIAALRPDQPALLIGASSPAPTLAAKAPKAADAERRQLTVMFCDLVGSTQLSQRLDPEDLSKTIRACQNAWRHSIERYDGFVARYMGDGILAYFGYPRAHEDDAERAIRAGLGVVEAMGGLNEGVGQEKGVALAVRVGIATGPVVVGDLIGEGASQESPVIGETPNLAARLQGIAEPNSVVVAPDTHRLTGGQFQFRPLGERALKGIARPVEAWQALGEGTAESRFEALRGQHLTPLVGRDEEVALLVRCWERAKEGEGHVVLISGEPGIGKSRLCETLRARIAEQSQLRLGYQCSPYHANSAFYPVISQLERAAEIRPQSDAEEKLDRLEALLRESSDALEEDVPLMAALLSIPLAERYSAIDVDAQEHKERTLEALVRQLEAFSAQRPILILFEDLHWVDPSTLELLDRLVERVEELPVLMLFTFRSEFHSNWTAQGHVTPLTLKRISKRESWALLDAVAGTNSLPENVVNEIVSKTDGVPLFIEEVTRALLEAQKPSGERALANTQLAVPRTLQDSLVARLDRLTIGKHVAQTGAAIGREFTEELLESVCELDRSELDQALDELVESGLLFRRGSRPGTTYTFKHALLQDASYNSLLLAKRKPLHRRIAETLTVQAPEQAAILAHHWECAEDFEMALHHRFVAAEQTTRLYAHSESIAQYSLALELLDRLPETQETLGRHADTVLAVIRATGITGRVSWQDEQQKRGTLRHLDKAIRTAAGDGDLALLARLEAYKGRNWGDEVLLAQAVEHADASGDKVVQAEVSSRFSGYLGQKGRFEDSFDHTSRAIEIYGQLGEETLQGFALAGEGRCFTARSGRLGDSLRYAERVREMAKTSDNLQIKAWTTMESEPHMYKGLWEETIGVAQENLSIAFEIGEWQVVLFASAWAALACIKLGRLEDAQRFLEEASAGVEQRAGVDYPRSYFEMIVAQLLLTRGETEKALTAARVSLELAERGGYLLEQGAAHRTLGQVHALGGNRSEAEVAFRRSLDLLGDIQSRPELAQTLLAYGRFKLDEDAEDGNRLLNRALELFQEMGATGWIGETQTVLNT
jgi:class 3 adenylate cyclase